MQLVGLENDADAKAWHECQFMTCSVLPVNNACNLNCPFCFSRSSISALKREKANWSSMDLDRYCGFAKERGARRLVVTGGGEPLLRSEDVVHIIDKGSKYFDEIAMFTNGSFLTRELSRRLRDAGLSYLCYSRHHHDDLLCTELMGKGTPTLKQFFDAADGLLVRATCVMTQGYVEDREQVQQYISRLSEFGVWQFTFKHTYVAYDRSVFGSSQENQWAIDNQVQCDPFAGQGTPIASLPWGPTIKRIGNHQVCFYFEPEPDWEKENRLCRSVNLLTSGEVFASLEDASSRLFQLGN